MKMRKIAVSDRETYLSLAQAFYRSPAVLYNIPLSYIETTFDEMIASDLYAEGAFIETDEGELMGYVLLSKSYSQECGGLVIWVEELSILPQYQGMGAGTFALQWAQDTHPEARRFRLEVEPENEGAIRLYERMGYESLSYFQMVKERAAH